MRIAIPVSEGRISPVFDVARHFVFVDIGLAEAARIDQADVLAALGGLPERSEHCALLAASTLKAAIEDFASR